MKFAKKIEEFTTLTPDIIAEARLYVDLIGVLKDGVPIPFDPTRIIAKIEKLESESGKDYKELKECCYNIGEIREAKEFKPYIRAALKKIDKLTHLGVDPIFNS